MRYITINNRFLLTLSLNSLNLYVHLMTKHSALTEAFRKRKLCFSTIFLNISFMCIIKSWRWSFCISNKIQENALRNSKKTLSI